MPEFAVAIWRREFFKLKADSDEEAKDLAMEWSTLEDRMQDTDFGDAPITDHSHDIWEIEALEVTDGWSPRYSPEEVQSYLSSLLRRFVLDAPKEESHPDGQCKAHGDYDCPEDECQK